MSVVDGTAGTPLGDTDPAPRSAPLARVDHRALRANAESWMLRNADLDAIADLRHDAWGHGVAEAAHTLLRLGVDGLVVDEGAIARLEDEHRDAPLAIDAESTIDAAELWGLPGSTGEPVLRLSGFVLMTKRLRAGEGVSYGHAHRATADTRIALVTGGYAQGIVRALGGRVRVTIGGAAHPIVGRVAMDVCVVDIGAAEVARGDEVVFFGDGPDDDSLEQWCAAASLTPGEIVAAVGARATREHVS